MDSTTKWMVRGACAIVIATFAFQLFGRVSRGVYESVIRPAMIEAQLNSYKKERLASCLEDVKAIEEDPYERQSLENFDQYIKGLKELCREKAGI